MPTYEYACTTCGERLEVVQSFHDEPLTACPACGGPLRKVIGAVGIVLKGSGFYKNDSRKPAPTASGGERSESKPGGADKGTTDTAGAGEAASGSGGGSAGSTGTPAAPSPTPAAAG